MQGRMAPTSLLLLALAALGPCAAPPVHDSAPTPAEGDDSAVAAVRFMRRFGYLESLTPEGQALYSNGTIREALLLVQKFGAIEQTGRLDEATKQLMKSPRCGVPDVAPESPADHSNRPKRYVIGSEGWKKRNVTYRLVNWSPKLGQGTTEMEFRKAFEAWTGYSRLRFSPAEPYTNADIEIFFARGPHGDGYPLDGPGGVLAHAFYPYEAGHWGGDMHFDEDEDWKVKPALDQGVDIFTVAVHELGHSLGLAHSFVSSSVMFPYYKGHQPNFRLDMDDIYGLYQLYIYSRPGDGDDNDVDPRAWGGEGDEEEGEGVDGSETRDPEEGDASGCHGGEDGCDTTPRRGGSLPTCHAGDICTSRIDAASVLRDELFFFSGECVWRMRDRGILLKGYPVPIRQLFSHLPGNVKRIDAAYQRLNDSAIVIFSGKNFWISSGDGLIQNSPRPLTDYGLPSTLEKVNAAMVWGKNDKIFIFSSDRYWRFNESTSLMDEGYPQPLGRWRGVPENLDAVLTWTDGASYFFSGSQFWRFDNTLIKIEEGFPLATSKVWFDCPNEEIL
ncbi:matrix metalloproteinase-17-like [Hetaerina americana]|uniref:matrix metalloproteinase-17-like n=1 Tax=Hetaerina americana TaxID=62018 RepID=UPI003A7F0FD8